MIDKTEMFITPHSDVKVFLGRKPFPCTRLSIDSEIETPESKEGVPIISYVTGRTLRVYDGELLLASTGHFRINVKDRTVRMVKRYTHLTPETRFIGRTLNGEQYSPEIEAKIKAHLTPRR